MNTIEHNKVEREEIKGLRFGKVIQNEDPDGVKRVKVRVRGVFNEPIKKEDIPWALPLIDAEVPVLGDEVCVIFEGEGDIERPRYFPKTVLDANQIGMFNAMYAAIVQTKKDSVKSGVTAVDTSIDEPPTESEGVMGRNTVTEIYPEDVATEAGEDVETGDPENGVMVEIIKDKDKESLSVYHPKGTFIDIHKNGDIIIHGVNDVYTIADGNDNSIVEGNKVMKVSGNLELKVDGGIKLVSDGAIEVEAASAELKATDVVITGGSLTVDGTAAPTGSGPFCALPSCVFSGAPHVGNKVSGT
jgi:hypothetical protein